MFISLPLCIMMQDIKERLLDTQENEDIRDRMEKEGNAFALGSGMEPISRYPVLVHYAGHFRWGFEYLL